MSQPAEQTQTPANFVFQNTVGKGSKQAPDSYPGHEETIFSESESCDRQRDARKKRRSSLDFAPKDTYYSQNTSVFSRLRREGAKPTRRRSPVSTTVFTREKSKEYEMKRIGQTVDDQSVSREPPSRKMRMTKANTGDPNQRNEARVWFDKLPSESINRYEVPRKAFLGNFSQQKKYIKDPVIIHHIKQRKGEPTKAFMERFKTESMHVNGTPECMRISGFMHSITNPDLIIRLNDNIPKTMDEMMNVTTAFLKGEAVVANQSKKKLRWRGSIARQAISKLRKERPTEGENKNKFYEFHEDKWHSTDECLHPWKQIEEAVRLGQLSHLINELKQGPNKGEHMKTTKKGDASNKEKEISFPYLASSDRRENPMVLEVVVVGHFIHRMYVDKGSASEIWYKHCFNRLHPKIKSRMTPATTPLLGFSGEISWLLGRISLAVSLGCPIHRPWDAKVPVKGVVILHSSLIMSVDMIGIPRSIAEHRLNIYKGCPPIRQKRKGQAPNRNKAIQEEVSKLIEAQIMREEQQILRDIEETFRTLRRINMKLKPKKCTFSAEECIFLGYIVNVKRIKACPNKEEAVIQLQSPRMLKGVQSLNGKLESLNRGGKGISGHKTMHHGTTNGTGIKLQFNGKASASLGTRLKETKKILSEAFDITYRPKSSIRSQVLADFIAERPEEDGPPKNEEAEEMTQNPWTLFTDGSSCLEGSIKKGINKWYQSHLEALVKKNYLSVQDLFKKIEAQPEITQNISSLKLPMLKTEDYDLWSMRMEQYLTHTDYALWEVIINGDSPVPKPPVVGTVVPPKTEAQKLARKNELKAKTIKITFGGNKESNKMHKTIFKKQYENFVASRSEGLDKTYDRIQKLISQLELNGEVISQEDAHMKLLRSLPLAWNNITLIIRNKPDIETLSMDDFYNNLKVYDAEIKGQSSSGSNSHNVAFVSSENINSINETNTAAHDIPAAGSKEQPSASSYADDVMFSFFASQSNTPHLDNEDLEHINTDDLEEIDLKWHVAMITMRGIFLENVVHQGIKSYQAEEGPTDFAIMALSSDSTNSSNSEHSSMSEIDENNNQTKDRYKVGIGYHAVPPPYTGNYMPLRADLSFVGLDDSVFKFKISETRTSVNEKESIASKSSEEIREEPKTLRDPRGRRRGRTLMDDTAARVPYGRHTIDRGIDISGPFTKAQGKVKFLIVAIDYFTKWIEAKPLATITGNQIKKFMQDNILCMFGLPGEIIFDNEKQFRDNPFKDWCEKLNIKQRFAFVKHPQTNGQVERANRSLGDGIKARLCGDNKNWVEELPHVLCAHHTEIKSRNGHTPFSLAYSTEAVILVEIGMPLLRCEKVDQAMNDEALLLNSDILEEMREKAAIQEAKQKWKNTITPRSSAQSSNLKISCNAVMKQAMQKKEESSAQNGRDRTSYFNPIPLNMKFNYDYDDMKLDEEAGYTTDEESVMSEHEVINPVHAFNSQSFEEELCLEKDLDECIYEYLKLDNLRKATTPVEIDDMTQQETLGTMKNVLDGLDKDEERGFDCPTFALASLKAHCEGCSASLIMVSLADKAILSGAENRPPILEKDMYDSWRSRMEMYMLNRQHGIIILESVEHGPLLWPSVTEEGVTRLKKYSKLSAAEAIQADCDVKKPISFFKHFLRRFMH
nr:reverse transcriptase domain-containing protein [Tanacetum cinerariifolium]